MTDREAFEAWCLKDLMIDAKSWKDPDGIYVYLQSEWLAYQAGRKQMAEEAAAVCVELLALSERQARAGDHFEIGREDGHRECLSAIRSLATPTEGKT